MADLPDFEKGQTKMARYLEQVVVFGLSLSLNWEYLSRAHKAFNLDLQTFLSDAASVVYHIAHRNSIVGNSIIRRKVKREHLRFLFPPGNQIKCNVRNTVPVILKTRRINFQHVNLISYSVLLNCALYNSSSCEM